MTPAMSRRTKWFLAYYARETVEVCEENGKQFARLCDISL